MMHNHKPLIGDITVSFPSKALLDEYKAAESFAPINPELLQAWEKIVKNAVFASHGLPVYISLNPESPIKTSPTLMYNRAGKSILLPLIKKFDLAALAMRQEQDDYRRGQITGAWYDESASIMEPPKPKPKNKPWYGKFNKNKYRK